LKGLAHEQFYRDKAVAIFGRYLKRGRDVTERVADQLQLAQEAGKISEEEYTQVMAADVLWGGQLRDGPEEIILVIEASWLAEEYDVERAVIRAEVLRRVGLKAIPIVAGQEWVEKARELALAQNVVITDNGRVDKISWQQATR
jgi:hypothetical protein